MLGIFRRVSPVPSPAMRRTASRKLKGVEQRPSLISLVRRSCA